ncbi:pollen-specific leucine-rich repeat extensin-like protein 4 [Iris pallida]|uniref:Pollen-specific leucine-rich repeat extensin-like protein 4 n=1 Tax=Iris pallida TaxID=29817 RepID=A0AAX6H1F9_IRIPA|nr:pollen-specific leucine-rich repeat extensin-like protein 4 [Iris pallida]KAJ6834859.1 pollen-specific leucine-rich repeat extensin-like protein 4 [Iris pallida]
MFCFNSVHWETKGWVYSEWWGLMTFNVLVYLIGMKVY